MDSGASLCGSCGTTFLVSRPQQRFCSAHCRNAYHVDHGHRGTVKSVRRLKRGWSIVLHADDAGGFELGEVLRLVRP